MIKKSVLLFELILALCPVTVFSQSVSERVKKDLVRQMISDGGVSAACVREEGGALKFVNVQIKHLDEDEQPEYLVTGKGCGCGGRMRCAFSFYLKTRNGYRLIFRSKPDHDLGILESRTNGFNDLEVTQIGKFDSYTVMKFNGRIYQK